MKDPAFLFYSSDFLSGVSDLTMDERGQFITLLCLQHQKGLLNEKTIRLCVGSVSVDVLNKFSRDENGNYFNKRLVEEIEKRNKYTESRRNNGIKGGRPSNKQTKNNNHKDNLMGNENINEDENKDVNEKSIEQRKIDFFNSVGLQFSSEYSKSTLSEFCEYWTEYNPNGKRMRFEMQKVFDTNRRLKTWSKNNFSNNGKPKSKFDDFESSLDRAIKLAEQFGR